MSLAVGAMGGPLQASCSKRRAGVYRLQPGQEPLQEKDARQEHQRRSLVASSIPSFVIASELPPSPSEREALEDKIRAQAAQLEKLQDGGECAPRIRPDELQKLIILLNTFDGRIKELEVQTERHARQIDDLTKDARDIQEDIEQIRDHFPRLIAEVNRRLKVLEAESSPNESATAQAHIEELYEHMETIGRKQVSFKEASRCLKLSKSRVLQLKTALALDDRFIIVPSQGHKQKKLIRLRKYYLGDDSHKTA